MKFCNPALVALIVTTGILSVNAQNTARRLGSPQSHRRRLMNFGTGAVCPDVPAGGGDGWFRVTSLGATDDDDDYDDASFFLENLRFDFNLNTVIWNSLYINTNGNLSFGEEHTDYEHERGSTYDFQIVAPFWADVDIDEDGDLYAKHMGDNTFAVAWDVVAHYGGSTDLRNTFMVMISDGTNPDFGPSNNICFCWGQMEWTTGDASDGPENGFGGNNAVVGVNRAAGSKFTVFSSGNTQTYLDTLSHTEMCFDATTSLVGTFGDPHVKTWGGDMFDYHGECDLVLLHAPDFDGGGRDLDIHIRTTIRYEYSYISQAAIKIGDDVLEVASFGDYSINGVATPDLEQDNGMLGGYNVYHTNEFKAKNRHSYDIQLGPNESIKLSTHKDIVAVTINKDGVSEKYFGNSVGLMGSFGDGTLLARDGTTVMEDMNAFGQEWQVQPDEPKFFRDSRYPQAPQQCILPTPKATDERRRLGEAITKEAAEAACAGLSSKDFEACVFDVQSFGDLEYAEDYRMKAGSF